MKRSQLYHQTIQTFRVKKVEAPELEARLLLSFGLGVSPLDILTDQQIILSEEDCQKLHSLIHRRLKGEPLSRIFGEKSFWLDTFLIGPAVLDPRPESELLVQEALRYIQGDMHTLVDLGTGSGCLLISLLKEKPHMRGIGVDLSVEALALAQENAQRLKVSARAFFVASHWLKAFKQSPFADIIISNPPYISSDEISSLAPEVRDYDPHLALDGSKDGLEAYRQLAPSLSTILKPEGYAFLECGYDQHIQVSQIFENHDLHVVKFCEDFSRIPRVLIVKKSHF